MTAQTESKTKEKTPESRSAYTPGDWKQDAHLYGNQMVVRTGERVICQVGLKGDQNDSQVIADATLIAAAPALYEALSLIVNFWKESNCNQSLSPSAILGEDDERTIFQQASIALREAGAR